MDPGDWFRDSLVNIWLQGVVSGPALDRMPALSPEEPGSRVVKTSALWAPGSQAVFACRRAKQVA